MHPPPEAKKEPKGYGITRVFNPPKTPQKGGWAPPGGGPGPPKGGVQGGGYTPPKPVEGTPPDPPGGGTPPLGGGPWGSKNPHFGVKNRPFWGGPDPPLRAQPRGYPWLCMTLGFSLPNFPSKTGVLTLSDRNFWPFLGVFCPGGGFWGQKWPPRGGLTPPRGGVRGPKKAPPRGSKPPPRRAWGGVGPPRGGVPGPKEAILRALTEKFWQNPFLAGKNAGVPKLVDFREMGPKRLF